MVLACAHCNGPIGTATVVNVLPTRVHCAIWPCVAFTCGVVDAVTAAISYICANGSLGTLRVPQVAVTFANTIDHFSFSLLLFNIIIESLLNYYWIVIVTLNNLIIFSILVQVDTGVDVNLKLDCC